MQSGVLREGKKVPYTDLAHVHVGQCAAWFESDVCVSYGSNITMLLTVDTGNVLQAHMTAP